MSAKVWSVNGLRRCGACSLFALQHRKRRDGTLSDLRPEHNNQADSCNCFTYGSSCLSRQMRPKEVQTQLTPC